MKRALLINPDKKFDLVRLAAEMSLDLASFCCEWFQVRRKIRKPSFFKLDLVPGIRNTLMSLLVK